MIQVGSLRKVILNCNQDWTIKLSKWEHCTEEELKKYNYPMPNLLSVQIVDTSSRIKNEGGMIYKYVFEDSEEEFVMTRDEMLWFFCGERDDNDLLDFVLEVEPSKGHINHIPLRVEQGDKGYSDKQMKIDLEEVERW